MKFFRGAEILMSFRWFVAQSCHCVVTMLLPQIKTKKNKFTVYSVPRLVLSEGADW